jgi:predicted ATP-grasp superfamily ATP-dependent carboligase
MSVLLTDGDQRVALAVVRSLGRAGIPVVVGHWAKESLAGTSRHCARRVCYPDPERDPAGFQEFLVREMRTGRYRLLLPITDVTTELVAERRSELTPHVRVPIPPLEVVARARDKQHVEALARQLGVEVPESYEPRAGESLEAFAARLPYPVVVKARSSRQRSDGGWVHGGVHYAATPEEFLRHYRATDAVIPAPVVQERLEGEGLGVFLLCWGGEVQAAFCHRRLREKPPWGGVSVLRESLPPDRELIHRSAELLRALGWEGAAMVEYKRDRRDGRAKLMEVNGRFWGSLQLAVDAGMDFPLLLYRLAMDQPIGALPTYRAGVKSRWVLGDLDHLLTVLRNRGKASGLPAPTTGRLRACLDFLLIFFDPAVRSEVQRWSDRGPGWYECRQWLKELFRARQPLPEKQVGSRAG